MPRNYTTPAFYKRRFELFARMVAEITEDIKTGRESPEYYVYSAIYRAMQLEGSSFDGARFDAAICKHARTLRGEDRKENCDEMPQDEWEAVTQ
jgi:hypothetical protein